MLEPAEVKRWERMTAAMLRHAEEDDPEAFAQIVKVLDDARAKLPEVAQVLTGQYAQTTEPWDGYYSWSQIGRALGITRQAARQRFGQRTDA